MYKKLLSLMFIIVLTGCSTTVVPVKSTFPDVPKSLSEPCSELRLVETEEKKLSGVLEVVTENYSKYHECKLKVQLWNEWYKEQKSNFESVK